jgi:nitroimidazol reductase NimA-like FMN-containing flavoprotein (pyridoxamine 5'-phosphate oxidase superfamily)
MEIDRNGLEVLGRDECMKLVRAATLGRVGLTSGALPTVLPVNYWADGDEIYVRTSRGTKLDAAMRDAVVAFEVDDFDTLSHAGWSVVITGVARVVSDTERLHALERAPIPRWAPEWDGHVLAISTELVSGRRMGDMPNDRWR